MRTKEILKIIEDKIEEEKFQQNNMSTLRTLQQLRSEIEQSKQKKMKKKIDIESEGVIIYVDGQEILEIGQVSDENTINLFLYPSGDLIKSIIYTEDPSPKCTHEIIVERKNHELKLF